MSIDPASPTLTIVNHHHYSVLYPLLLLPQTLPLVTTLAAANVELLERKGNNSRHPTTVVVMTFPSSSLQLATTLLSFGLSTMTRDDSRKHTHTHLQMKLRGTRAGALPLVFSLLRSSMRLWESKRKKRKRVNWFVALFLNVVFARQLSLDWPISRYWSID